MKKKKKTTFKKPSLIRVKTKLSSFLKNLMFSINLKVIEESFNINTFCYNDKSLEIRFLYHIPRVFFNYLNRKLQTAEVEKLHHSYI